MKQPRKKPPTETRGVAELDPSKLEKVIGGDGAYAGHGPTGPVGPGG